MTHRQTIAVLAIALCSLLISNRAEANKYPGDSRGGYGFYGYIVPLNVGNANLDDGKEKWKGDLTGGFGLFGEYLVLPRLAIGLDATLMFPEVVKKSGSKCTTCKNDILVQILGRVKVPIPINRKSSIYPVAFLGYSYYRHFTSEYEKGLHGLGFGAGFGTEVYTVASAISIEIRYVLHHTPESAPHGSLMDHSLLILMAFRLL